MTDATTTSRLSDHTYPRRGTDARAMLNALYRLEAQEVEQDATPQRLAGIRAAIACARAAYQDAHRHG